MRKNGIIICICVFVVIWIIIIGVRIYQSQNSFSLDSNTLPPLADGATQFDDNDLILGNLTYGMTRSDVVRILGTPDEEKDSLDQSGSPFIYGRYITYSYGDDLTLTFYNFGRGEMLLRKCYYNKS